MTINQNSLYILIPLILINLIAFFVMLSDKIRSNEAGAERTPEGILFFMAAMFGAVGVYAGMFAWRHKTRKWYFVVGIPLLIIENLATAYLLYLFVSGVLVIF